MTRPRLTRLQACLIAIAVTTYLIGWLHADKHTAHAIGWWVLTVLASVGAVAAGNVNHVVDRIMARMGPDMEKIIQLEHRQLKAMKRRTEGGGQDEGIWGPPWMN